MGFNQVPAIRMFLDFVVHLFMLTLYTLVVLEGDDGSVSTTEIVLTFHVTVRPTLGYDGIIEGKHEGLFFFALCFQ